ncbi:MAG: enoyl-CoA hydratase [Rhodobiaceae bacterium]|nr:enoyl-CoA hydratase [Rhodobiaceae bacterium]
MITTSEHIDVNRTDGVLTLTMNRPAKKNALTQEMYAALADNVVAAQSDPDIRVVVLTGTADSFTAGNDLADFAGGPGKAKRGENEIPPVGRFLQAILQAEKPLLAAVNGLAVGVGVTMLLHCDLVYASPNATFQTPFVNLGLVPEAGSSLLMPRLVGQQKANELLLLGKKIDAAEAERIGLIAGVLDADTLQHDVAQVAATLAARAPNAVKLTKSLVKHERDDVAQQMADESVHFSAQLQTAEFAEAASAFAERRPADFSKL